MSGLGDKRGGERLSKADPGSGRKASPGSDYVASSHPPQASSGFGRLPSVAPNAPPQPSVPAPACAVCFPSGQRRWRVPDASPLPAPAPALPARLPTRTCSRALRSGSDPVSSLARSLSLHSKSSAVPATLGGPRGTLDLMASLQVSEPSRGPRCAVPPHSAGPPGPL